MSIRIEPDSEQFKVYWNGNPFCKAEVLIKDGKLNLKLDQLGQDLLAGIVEKWIHTIRNNADPELVRKTEFVLDEAVREWAEWGVGFTS